MFLFTAEAGAASMVHAGSYSTNDDQTLAESRAWVEGIIAKMHACPYVVSADNAGGGGVGYPISHATNAEGVLESYWHEVVKLYSSTEKQLATTLLLTPCFAMNEPEVFKTLCNEIKETLHSLGIT